MAVPLFFPWCLSGFRYFQLLLIDSESALSSPRSVPIQLTLLLSFYVRTLRLSRFALARNASDDHFFPVK